MSDGKLQGQEEAACAGLQAYVSMYYGELFTTGMAALKFQNAVSQLYYS